MRVCEYLPIGLSKRDENGELIDTITSGFDDGYQDYVNYEGEEGKDSNFKIKIVNAVSMTKDTVNDVLEEFKNFVNKEI